MLLNDIFSLFEYLLFSLFIFFFKSEIQIFFFLNSVSPIRFGCYRIDLSGHWIRIKSDPDFLETSFYQQLTYPDRIKSNPIS
ncbi:hypothetical protein HanRHA438_Chr08g0358121 [Helianthus annuus]|nr:hypothetical protein HanRHA438_Chr08g0358121 [Helianthus annuus]